MITLRFTMGNLEIISFSTGLYLLIIFSNEWYDSSLEDDINRILNENNNSISLIFNFILFGLAMVVVVVPDDTLLNPKGGLL